MANDQLNVNHTIRKARKNHLCNMRECQNDILAGLHYMEVKEYRAVYRWCLECWNKKTR